MAIMAITDITEVPPVALGAGEMATTVKHLVVI
jgi:hypothetical protein